MAIRIDPPAVHVADTGTARGRGACAPKPFAAGELVEVCPVVPFDMRTRGVPQPIERIMFGWGYLTDRPGEYAIVLGYGSIYNHANPANMLYRPDGEALELHFVAVRDIAAGEELTINYNAHGGGAEWDDDGWFRRMNIVPLAET